MPLIMKSVLLSVLATLCLMTDVASRVANTQNMSFDLFKKSTIYGSSTQDRPNQFDVDKGRLSGQTRTLDVSFAAISCPCAMV